MFTSLEYISTIRYNYHVIYMVSIYNKNYFDYIYIYKPENIYIYIYIYIYNIYIYNEKFRGRST